MSELSKKGMASRQWRDKCRAAGKCIRCGTAEPTDGYKQCYFCRNLHRQETRVGNQRLKDTTFAAYGGYTCACCLETHSHEFMSIDHVNGDGSKHKKNGQRLKGVALYRWLKDNNYPIGFQVLCYNCNGAKQTGQECPHKAQRQGMLKRLAAFPLEY